ncbi:MAG: hypothetical protein AAF547_14330 [Actinomycetota bacterium]
MANSDPGHNASVRVGDDVSPEHREALDASAERAQELNDAHLASRTTGDPLPTHSEAEVRAFVEGVRAARRSVA